MLNLLPLRTPLEFQNLIIGIIKQREAKSISWGEDDEENEELNKLMDDFENNGNDWASNEEENAALNDVMDKYEGASYL